MYFLLNDNNLDVNRLGAAKMAHCLADQAGIYLSFLPYFAKNAEKMTLGKDWYKIRLLLPPGRKVRLGTILFLLSSKIKN